MKNFPENVTIELVKKISSIWITETFAKGSYPFFHAEVLGLKSSTDSIHSFLNFIANHVKCLIEAVDEKNNNIKPVGLPAPSKPTILSSKKDPGLLEQVFNELKDRDGIVEFTVFTYTPGNRKKQRK